MANELDTTQKATIDDDTNPALAGGAYSVTSSDTAVAVTATLGGFWYCIAQAEGVTTLEATRLADGATGTVDVTVVAAPEPGTFVIQLGAISPK